MSMTDPVADFLTLLRNAAKAQHHDFTLPASRLKSELARILKEHRQELEFQGSETVKGHIYNLML